MKNWIKKFIESLAKSNAETFQGKPLDCCSLNNKTFANKSKQNK